MEAALGTEARPEPMSVVVRQEKLLEKLNLDGLAHWSLQNAAAARELVLAYHDVFTLENNKLGQLWKSPAKLAPMHIVDWEEAQEADTALAACHNWLHLRKDTPLPKRDAFLKECLEAEAESEQGKMFFCIHNSLTLDKGLMYVSTTPKGKTEGVLTFVFPVGQSRMALLQWCAS